MAVTVFHTTIPPDGSENAVGYAQWAEGHAVAGLGTAAESDASAFAPAAEGVTNGNSHDHSGGDGAQIAYSTLSGLPTLGTAAATASTDYAPAAQGVTGGNSHDHNGGDGAQIAYSSLSGPPTAKRTIGVTFDGGGSPPTAGSVGYAVAQFAGNIDRWDIVADVSGNAVVDVWKVAGAIPTDANRIAGTEKPTLAAQQLALDAALSTWSTLAVAVGDVLGFELESVATCSRVTCQVRVAETL